MKFKPVLMAAVAGIALSAGTASAVCVQEGFLEYSNHTSPTVHTFFLRPSTGATGSPFPAVYSVKVDTAAPGTCPGLGHTDHQVTWGFIVQGTKMRVRIIGSAATCPTAGTVRDMGCFQGAVAIN